MSKTVEYTARIKPHLVEHQHADDHQRDRQGRRPGRSSRPDHQAHHDTHRQQAYRIDQRVRHGPAPGHVLRSLRDTFRHGLHHADIGELRGEQQEGHVIGILSVTFDAEHAGEDRQHQGRGGHFHHRPTADG